MDIIRSRDFTGTRAWDALDIASMNGITTRLHWTDQPYKWHVNDGAEVFAVLDGMVRMFYRDNGVETSVDLAVVTSSMHRLAPHIMRIRKARHGFW